MPLKSCLCFSFQSDKISKWQNVLDLIMNGQIACYSWVNFILHMFDLAWSIHRKYRPNKIHHTLTPPSNHCKFLGVPHAIVKHVKSGIKFFNRYVHTFQYFRTAHSGLVAFLAFDTRLQLCFWVYDAVWLSYRTIHSVSNVQSSMNELLIKSFYL